MITLTPDEKKVLAVLFESAEGNGHDFGLIEDARGVVPATSLGGIVGSLSKKGIFTVHGKVTTNDGGPGNVWTQFTWNLNYHVIKEMIK